MGWPKGVPRKPVAVVEGEDVSPYAGEKNLKISFKNPREGFTTETFEDREDVSFPFDDESVSEMFFDNILQFVHNFIPVMNEAHRTLKPMGTLTIVVPMYPHKFAFQDPMTVRQFTDTTFLYFWNQAPFFQNYEKEYGLKPFKNLAQTVNGPFLTAVLRK